MKYSISCKKPQLSSNQQAKLQAARKRKQTERRSWRNNPLLKLDRWTIFRLDEHNIVLSDRPEDEEHHRYYPKIADAVKMLLHEEIEATIRARCVDFVEAVRKAEAAIVAAVEKAGIIGELSAENAQTLRHGQREGRK